MGVKNEIVTKILICYQTQVPKYTDLFAVTYVVTADQLRSCPSPKI